MRTRALPHAESDKVISDPQKGLERLLEIMRRLRDPEHGCPWDLAQTFETIAPYTIEEAYEVADAINRNAMSELPGELGDLLLQVVYHSQIGAEQNTFSFDDVVKEISDKMIRRHPHVFGDWAREDFKVGSWEKLKDEERASTSSSSVLDNVPANLPGMTRAVKLQSRAARVGFDWPNIDGVLDKIHEEARELAEAIACKDTNEIEGEYADLLFVMANLGRHLNVDPEKALRRVNAKFERRFKHVEQALTVDGKPLSDATLEQMDELWDQAKQIERSGGNFSE